MNINELITTFRKHKDISQLDFSKKINCSRSRLSRIESGELVTHQFEMARMFDHFPSLHWMLLQNQGAQPLKKRQSFEWPSEDHYLSRVDASYGNFLDEQLWQLLGEELRLSFWKTIGIQRYQILFQTMGYPLEFLWRMVQWLLIHQKLQSASELKQFCHKVLATNKELSTIRLISENLYKQFEMFLDSWCIYSANYDVDWTLQDNQVYFIHIAPKHDFIKKLCFRDPILSPFILKFMQVLVELHFNQQVSVLVVQEGDSWKMNVNLTTI